MSNKNFVNYHILISHSPSCLNRDDMNMQKTAVFGGVRRVRISSQSLKRAMRRSQYYAENLGQPSVRTRQLDKIKEKLVAELKDEFEEALVAETVERFVKASKGAGQEEGEGVDAEEQTADEDKQSSKLAVAPWVAEEIRELCRIVAKVKAAGLTDKELASAKEKLGKQKGKKKKAEQELIDELWNKKIEKEIETNCESLRAAHSKVLDIALSGRMATSGLMTSVDGALAVAHVITTHAVDGDIDWFTAVDDLVAEAGEVGAGHLNTQELSAGVFYRYASLNLKQLQVNLGLIRDMKDAETPQSRAKALGIASHVLHLLATVVPSAKQQSMAAHNPAEFALVSFADQPISLSNAFETPITNGRGQGFLPPSIAALAGYWDTVNTKYGLDERAAVFSLREFEKPDPLRDCKTLPKLESWLQNDGREKI
jgi:CRISPR system Cascade subunit CasC